MYTPVYNTMEQRLFGKCCEICAHLASGGEYDLALCVAKAFLCCLHQVAYAHQLYCLGGVAHDLGIKELNALRANSLSERLCDN